MAFDILTAYGLGVLIGGIINTYFGFTIFFKNKKALSNILYCFLSLAFALWSFAWVALIFVDSINSELAYYFARLLNFGAIFIPIFYLHWVLSVLEITKEKKKILIFGYLLSFLFVCFSWTPLYVKGVHPILFFPHWPTAGPLYKWYLIFGYFGLVSYGLYLLLKSFLKATGERKTELKYVILGSMMGFGGGAINFPLMYGIIPFGSFSTLGMFIVLAIFIPFPGPLSYILMKYRFMGVRVILTEILVFATGLTLLIWAVMAEPFVLKILGGALFVFFVIFGYQLVRSVIKEIELRAELEKAYKELERIDRAKTEFLSMASHQLRTPLGIIKGYLSMMLEGDYGEIPKEAKEKLKNAYVSNDRLVKLVNDLLDITRLEMGKIELKLERASIEEIISGVIEEMKPAAEKKGLYLKYEGPKVPLPEMMLDKEKIRQVILNLVDNGIKYTQKGGVEIKLKIENLKLKIEITDTGVGLSKEEIENLFEIMARGRAGLQYWMQGAGLGLYTARKFVEMHGGKIWAKSAGKDKGSTFYIELPIK
jgi:signal transduction histidine kinase